MCSDAFVDKVKVILEHPNGEEPFIAELTEEEQSHRVDKGEGGGTYRVCFQNLKPKGRSTRVEVRGGGVGGRQRETEREGSRLRRATCCRFGVLNVSS